MNLRVALTLLTLTALVPPSLARGEEALPSLAVLDVRGGEGISKEIARFTTSAVARAAGDTQAFRVISAEDIRALLTLEAQKSLCGAGSESCLAEIGGALGADYLVSGTLTRLGEKTNLELSLLDVKRAKNLSRASRTFQGEGELLDIVPAATVELLGKALEGRRGTLVVSVTEPGATVKIDGRIVGVSPLAPQTTVAGTHLVEVEKKGFISQQEQVLVKADQTAARSVALVPSPDFLDAYQASARRMRLGAWLSTGVGLAALGTAVFFNAQADRIHQDFVTERDLYTSGAVSDTQELTRLQTDGLGAQTVANVSFGLAGAATVAAAYFWIAGDDPGRYGRYQVAILPTPEGGVAFAALRF